MADLPSSASTESDAPQPQSKRKRLELNATLFKKLLVVTVAMFAFGYALVPLYKKICEITGINNITQKDDVSQSLNTQIDPTRTITVEFDANTTGPLRFRPIKNFVKVHPGELSQVTYEVVNALDRPVAVQAIPSYAPHNSAAHFKKLECFCFAQQTLSAKQAKQMPVVFVIDKTLPNNIDTITLSYTFFEVPGALKP